MCRSEQYSVQTARQPEILKKHQKEICKFVPEKKKQVLKTGNVCGKTGIWEL